MTVDELLEVLSSGAFDALAGVAEDASIDFKGAPYQLDSEAGKHELAKDVASFASAQGPSVIVFPVETERTPESPFERAVRVRPIARSRINEKQIRDLIRSHVYPTVRDVDIRVFTAAGGDKCVVAILVPAQRVGDKPFLVLSPLGQEDEKVQGWLIGLPTRAFDETEQIRPAELHELISRGRTVATRLEEIAAMIAHAGAAADPTPALDRADATWERARAAADAFAGHTDLYGTRWIPPVLVLAAAPADDAIVPSLFQSDGVREVVERPPYSRHEGWSLVTLNRAELVEGTRLQVHSGRRKLITLFEDGTFIAVAPILELLSRDPFVVPEGARPLFKVNSLAVAEFTHDFVLTYQSIAPYIEPPPEEVYFGIGILAATGSPAGDVVLPPHGVDSIAWLTAEVPDDAQRPDTASFTWSYTERLDKNPGEIAYRLLEQVYAYFKHTTDAIPYLNDDRSAVDPATFSRSAR